MFARKVNTDLSRLSEDLRRGWTERPREVHDLCHPRNPLVAWVKFCQYLLPPAKAKCAWAYPWLISNFAQFDWAYPTRPWGSRHDFHRIFGEFG